MLSRATGVVALALPVLLLLAALPFGEHPVNDDWQMYWSAFHFARTGELRILDYSAMGLVGWSALGGALAKVTGESFVALRMLAVAAHGAAGWFAWRAACGAGLGRAQALRVSLTVTLCPVAFWLATSFMTDTPFLAAWAGAIWAWTQGLRTGSRVHFAAGAVCVAWASWMRLPVVALPIALVAAAVVCGCEPTVRRRALAAAGASVVAGPVAFLAWYHGVHGPTQAYLYKSSGGAAEMLASVPRGVFAVVVYGTLFLLPLAPCVLWGAGRKPARAVWISAAAAAAVALLHAKTGMFGVAVAKSMPYLPNVFYNLGLGPMTLTDVLREGGPPPVRVSGALQVAAGVALAAVGGALAAALVARVVPAVRARRDPVTAFLACGVVLYLGAAILFSRASAPLFDRYLVPMILPLALLLVAPAQSPAGTRAGSVSWALLAVSAAFATLATGDYHRFTQARFRLADAAVRETGTTFRVDAGAEFNLWHNYVPSTRGEFTPAPGWPGWLADPALLVASREREGYDVVAREPVLFTVGWRRWDLLLLRRR